MESGRILVVELWFLRWVLIYCVVCSAGDEQGKGDELRPEEAEVRDG